MNTPKLKQKLSRILIIAFGVTLLCSTLAVWNPLEKWQFKLSNRLYDRNEPSDEIVIVGIDEGSLSEEAGIGKWKTWTREVYATVIEELEDAGAKVIALDLYFTEKSTGISENRLLEILDTDPTLNEYVEETVVYLEDDHPDDLRLADVFDAHDNIIVAENFILSGEKGEVEGIPVLDVFEGKVDRASVVYYPDSDDLARRVPLHIWDAAAQEELSAFSLSAVEKYRGETLSGLPEGELMIDYAAPPYSFEILSFANVHNGYVNEEDVKDKIVLMGVVTERIQDHALTPTSPDTPMPGVEMHANAIQTILEGDFLHEQSIVSQIVTIAMLTLLLTVVVMAVGIIPGVGVAAGAVAAYQLIAEPLFDRGVVINLVYPTLALLGAYLVTTLYKYVTEAREKRQLKGAFSKYVNKDLAGKILENPEMLKLGGESRTVTVFFSDIANFTNFSEKSSPEALVAQLNEYFEVMAGIILKNGGNLNKFEGDAIMAFWGAPLDEPNHATLAAQSALECRAALTQLHEKWEKEGKPLLDFRVGLSTGEVIAGNVGSSDRFDYTIMGDIVNLGSRLEGANKIYGSHIMIADATATTLGDKYELRRLDRLRVKGKDEPVDVYELLAAKGQLNETHTKIVQDFHQAIEYYRNLKFADAETRFQEIAKLAPSDGPTKTYLARCAQFKQTPPTEGWDGTWTLEHK